MSGTGKTTRKKRSKHIVRIVKHRGGKTGKNINIAAFNGLKSRTKALTKFVLDPKLERKTPENC